MPENAIVDDIQTRIQRAIADSFSVIGGDHTELASAVSGHSVDSWVNNQVLWAGIGGAVGGLFRSQTKGIGSFAGIVGDTMYMLNRAARLSYGIGYLKGAHVFGPADLVNIWEKWLNVGDGSSELLSVSGRLVRTANQTMSTWSAMTHLFELIQVSRDQLIIDGEVSKQDMWNYDLAFINTPYHFNQTLDSFLKTFDPVNTRSTIIGSSALKKIARHGATLALRGGSSLVLNLAGKIGLSVGTQVAIRTNNQGSLLDALASSGTSAAINAFITKGISQAAIEYYSAPLVP